MIISFTLLFLSRILAFLPNTDPLSLPQYRLAFASSSIDEQTALGKLIQSDHHLLRLNGSRYVCEVPSPRRTVQSQTPLLSPSEAESEIKRLALIANELLRPLTKDCVYHASGWWTYAYCPGRYFKQYHSIPGTIPPQPDERYDEYVMGRGSNGTVQNIEGVWTYIDRLDHGDFCGLIGKERFVEIMVTCNPTPKLSRVKEISTCIYQASFGTPLLCQEKSFIPPPPEESTDISCQKITSFPEIEDESKTPSQLLQQSSLKVVDMEQKSGLTEENTEDLSAHIADKDETQYATINLLVTDDGDLKPFSNDAEELNEEEKEQLDKLKKKLEKHLKSLFDGHFREF